MLSIAARFTSFLADLRVAVAAHAPRNPQRTVLFGLLWGRLGRMASRFESLFAKWQAGALPKPRKPRANPPRTRRPTPRLPQRRAWLLAEPEIFRLAAAACRSRLEHLFTDPAMAAFLQAAPQAGRILRPLCHMLGITAAPDLPAVLALPPPPRFRPAPPPTPPYRGIENPPEVAPPVNPPRDRSGRAWYW